MSVNLHKVNNHDKIKHLQSFPFIEAAIGVIVFVMLTALFLDTKNMPLQNVKRIAQTNGSSALSFDVISVNPVIAREFNLAYAAGVLVNSPPTGAARRLIDIHRGDIILQFNKVNVASANHFAFLM